jgi:hypothetical protein
MGQCSQKRSAANTPPVTTTSRRLNRSIMQSPRSSVRRPVVQGGEQRAEARCQHDAPANEYLALDPIEIGAHLALN